MSTMSPPGAAPASTNAGAAARSHWSVGGVVSSAAVVLIGIAVGCVIGVFIGLATGWIEIQIC